MIELVPPKPKWLGLGNGVRVLTKPLSYFRYTQLHRKMADVIKDASAANATVKELSGGVLDASDTPVSESLVMLAAANELIVDWDGLGDGEGNKAPIEPKYVAIFCDKMVTGPMWWSMVQSPIMELIAEGEGLAGAPNGSSVSSAERSAARADETTSPVSQQGSGETDTPAQPSNTAQELTSAT